MGKRLRPSDVTRLTKAAIKAGIVVARIEADTEAGKVVIIAAKPGDESNDETPEDLRKLI